MKNKLKNMKNIKKFFLIKLDLSFFNLIYFLKFSDMI